MSMSLMDYALGQPHHPAYLPLFLLNYEQPMTFLQRVLNTISTMGFQYVARCVNQIKHSILLHLVDD